MCAGVVIRLIVVKGDKSACDWDVLVEEKKTLKPQRQSGDLGTEQTQPHLVKPLPNFDWF
jgi:hypothetical protein